MNKIERKENYEIFEKMCEIRKIEEEIHKMKGLIEYYKKKEEEKKAECMKIQSEIKNIQKQNEKLVNQNKILSKENIFFDTQKEFYTKSISVHNHYRGHVKSNKSLNEIISQIESEFKEK